MAILEVLETSLSSTLCSSYIGCQTTCPDVNGSTSTSGLLNSEDVFFLLALRLLVLVSYSAGFVPHQTVIIFSSVYMKGFSLSSMQLGKYQGLSDVTDISPLLPLLSLDPSVEGGSGSRGWSRMACTASVIDN